MDAVARVDHVDSNERESTYKTGTRFFLFFCRDPDSSPGRKLRATRLKAVVVRTLVVPN